MFPVGDTNVRGARFPIVTITLIVVNVLVFLYELMLGDTGLEAFFNQWAVVPAEILQGGDLYTLITSMFLHGGWLHLIGNMLFLWVFGDNIEAVLGPILYSLFYLAGGIGASLAHVWVNPTSTIPSLGASGAIAAVLGAYILMFPHSSVRLAMLTPFGFYITRTSALIFLGIWALMQIFSGIASLGPATAQTSGVAFWAHIGGFVVGLVTGLLLRGRARQVALM
jgi:membrane associated rhomboid family serine protease